MPFSIAGPAYAAIPSMEGINRVAERISSGEQTSFEQNAAEAAIAGRFDAAIGESTVAIRNATNQVSALQKADQSLEQVSQSVLRAQELAFTSGNGALSPDDQAVLASASQQLLKDASQTLESATFNTNNVFEITGIDIDALKLQLDEIRSSGAALDGEQLESIQQSVSELRALAGAGQNALGIQVDQLASRGQTLHAAQSELADVDFAEEMTNLIAEQIQFEVSVKVFDKQQLATQSVIDLLT